MLTPNTDPAEIIAQVDAFVRQGELLQAYDCASKALATFPVNRKLQYLCTLSLARSGALNSAIKIYTEFGLSEVPEEDYIALSGRLYKDAALRYASEPDKDFLRLAIEQYQRAFELNQGYYPAINIATLHALSGENQKAEEYAQRALELLKACDEGASNDRYYREATKAEAYLLLKNWKLAEASLQNANQCHDNNYSAIVTTRRHLKLVCDASHMHLLKYLKNPGVIHFCGHIISAPDNPQGRFLARDEERVAKEIESLLELNNIGFGFGSLAAGADILFAEALLKRGGEIDIFLPFKRDEFVEISVACAGEQWITRFESVMERASSVSYASEGQYLGDNSLFAYCSRLAMGRAIIKARHLDADIRQFAVWDHDSTNMIAGTAADLDLGKRIPVEQAIISVSGNRNSDTADTHSLSEYSRDLRAVVFADIKGFSRLDDRYLGEYVDVVLGEIGKVIESLESDVLFRNTWGDGIFIVFSDATSAARCAVKLQNALDLIEGASDALSNLSLRVGADYGPVIEKFDPILKQNNYYGSHVTRAARIEPVTPTGKVYVTWQFASELALSNNPEIELNYVGKLATAKSYGDISMYHLNQVFSVKPPKT